MKALISEQLVDSIRSIPKDNKWHDNEALNQVLEVANNLSSEGMNEGLIFRLIKKMYLNLKMEFKT